MRKFLLAFIIIAFFLRFYQLGGIPASLTWDEVAWGYNAYSLGIDGRDEFGVFLPHNYFESFGDFKPPVYAYLDVFPIKFFGLNEFAVRVPSALFGALTVLVAYFLTKRIFSRSLFAKEYALVASFLLAISPWHIMLSRAAFEANIATFFLATGVWLFLAAVQNRPWVLIFSAVSFVLSLYTFNSARIVAPILVIGLAIAYYKKLFLIKKQVIVALLLGLALLLPSVPFLLSPQARLRFQEVNIFTDATVIKQANQEMINDQNVWWSKMLHNRRIIFGFEYCKHFFDNLSSSFLFIIGDGNTKFSTQSLGQMYVFEFPFLILGILLLIRKREKNWWIIPFWLLSGIVPAATARETPHALRIEGSLPMFQILVAYGIVQSYLFLTSLKHKYALVKRSVIILFTLFVVGNVAYFVEDYFVHYAKATSVAWQYGYKDAIAYVDQVDSNYSKIFVTQELGRPYIYTLFYKKYDPLRFRQNAIVQRDAFGFVAVKSFDKYYFDKDALDKTHDKNVLFIESPNNLPENALVKKKFYFLDGTVSLVAYTL